MMNKIFRDKGIFLILTAFLIVAVWFNSGFDWWDSAVYVGMGKFLYSGGSAGLWEPARPIILPLVLGFIWILKGDPLVLGTLLNVAMSMGTIYILYLLIKELLSKKTALLFSFLFALNTTLMFYANKILVDIPGMFFTLLSFWFLVSRKKYFTSGVLIGIATLTKFTSAIFIPIFLIGIYMQNKNFVRTAAYFVIGSTFLLLPYFLINLLIYQNPFHALIKGQELINSVVGNYTCPTSSLFFFDNILKEVPLLGIAIVSLFGMRKIGKLDWRWTVIALAFLLPLIYHVFLVNCKDMRYTFLFLPFLYLLAAKGYSLAAKHKEKMVRYAIFLLVSLQIIFSIGQGYYAYNDSSLYAQDPAKEVSQYLTDIEGEVWSTTPLITLTTNVKISELMYYPVFDNEKINQLKEDLNENVQYLVVNTCDIPCVRYDADCSERKTEFLDELENKFRIIHQQNKGECKLTVYKR